MISLLHKYILIQNNTQTIDVGSSLSIDHIITTIRGLPHSAGCRMSLTSIDLVVMMLTINCNQTTPFG